MRILTIVILIILTWTEASGQFGFVKSYQNGGGLAPAGIAKTPDTNIIALFGVSSDESKLSKLNPKGNLMWSRSLKGAHSYFGIGDNVAPNAHLFMLGHIVNDTLGISEFSPSGASLAQKAVIFPEINNNTHISSPRIYDLNTNAFSVFLEIDSTLHFLKITREWDVVDHKAYQFDSDFLGTELISSQTTQDYYVVAALSNNGTSAPNQDLSGVVIKGNEEGILKARMIKETGGMFSFHKVDSANNLYLGWPSYSQERFNYLKLGPKLEKIKAHQQIATSGYDLAVEGTYPTFIQEKGKLFHSFNKVGLNEGTFLVKMDSAFNPKKTVAYETGAFNAWNLRRIKPYGLYFTSNMQTNNGFDPVIFNAALDFSGQCSDSFTLETIGNLPELNFKAMAYEELQSPQAQIQDHKNWEVSSGNIKDSTLCTMCGYDVDLGNDDTLCQEDTLAPISTPNGTGVDHLWSTGDTTEKIAIKESGDYALEADWYDCPVDRDSIAIEALPKPHAKMNLSQSKLEAYDDLFYEDKTPRVRSRFWAFGQGDTVTSRLGNFRFEQTGSFPVTLHVTNLEGCSDTAMRIVEVGGQTIYIPNAFSPDGNGVNDRFAIEGIGIQHYRLKIYNRWGEKLFEGSNEGWNGRYKGKKAPNGTYLYEIAIDVDNQTLHRKGTVKLLR